MNKMWRRICYESKRIIEQRVLYSLLFLFVVRMHVYFILFVWKTQQEIFLVHFLTLNFCCANRVCVIKSDNFRYFHFAFLVFFSSLFFFSLALATSGVLTSMFLFHLFNCFSLLFRWLDFREWIDCFFFFSFDAITVIYIRFIQNENFRKKM